MATVRYGDVVQASEEALTIEEKLKRRRASQGSSTPQDSSESSFEQTESKPNNEPKRSA